MKKLKASPLLHPIYGICFGMYFLNRILRLEDIQIILFSDHIASLVALPLVLGFILTLFRWFRIASRLSWHQVLSSFLIFSIYFEYWLPAQSARYTGDWMDVVFYGIGGIVFWVFLNDERGSTSEIEGEVFHHRDIEA